MRFQVKAGSLYLVLDATVGTAYNLTLIWNKHMTLFIKIARASQVFAAPAPWPGLRAEPPTDSRPRRTPYVACAATTTGT